AGRKAAVTIATNMAGRGTDIILGGNPPDAEAAESVKTGSVFFGLGDFNVYDYESRAKKPEAVDRVLLAKMNVDAKGWAKATEKQAIAALNALLDQPDLDKALEIAEPPAALSAALREKVAQARTAGQPVDTETLRAYNRALLESLLPENILARERRGGLHILGTERHESRRIDNQLRGRAGRQGDPGSSRFYLALDDELMRLFGSERMQAWMGRLGMQEGEDIQHPWVNKAIESAQTKVEAMNFDIRKQLLDFDNVMNKQREAVYKLRNAILDGLDLTDRLKTMMVESLEEKLALWAPEKAHSDEWDFQSLKAWLSRGFGVEREFKSEVYPSSAALLAELTELLEEAFQKRASTLGADLFRQMG
ncbi:MAG TPA: hypothetical protein PKZ00_11460, partial [Elusimicrobiota bacterium]|nr:hypothetical protein [Elusimicrobiota bacterium]